MNLAVTPTHTGKPIAAMEMGPYFEWRQIKGPTVPPETACADASPWELRWDNKPAPGISNIRLEVDYAGDIARLYSSSNLLDDNFFNGLSRASLIPEYESTISIE